MFFTVLILLLLSVLQITVATLVTIFKNVPIQEVNTDVCFACYFPTDGTTKSDLKFNILITES